MIEVLALILILIGVIIVIKGLKEPEYFGEEYEIYYPEREIREEGKERIKEKREVRGGGVILIGPIPIVFGDSKYATIALILTIILMLLVLAFWVRI